MNGAGFRAVRIDGGVKMSVNFTQSQLSLMSDADRADIARAEQEGFKKPCYIRMTRDVRGDMVAYEQPFSPAALRAISNGKSYPASATPENCEKLIKLWNTGSGNHYSMV